jgi:TatD DNase family protein
MAPMLFDAHTHLQDARLTRHIDAIMTAARRAGVAACVCCGTQPADWDRICELVARYPSIVPAFGVHPWYAAAAVGDWLHRIETRVTQLPTATIGEIGLDRALTPRTDEIQLQVFTAQIELAGALHRPFSLHCREAWGILVATLRRYAPFPAGFLVHAYSGSAELIPELAALGAYFSFAGGVVDPRTRRAARTVPAVPEDRLLVETDTPDMLPRGGVAAGLSDAGRPLNQPANLPLTIRRLAELRGCDADAIAACTSRNAARLFGAPRPTPASPSR